MTDILSDMIAEREARRQKLASQLAEVDAELRALREAQSRASGVLISVPAAPAPSVSTGVPRTSGKRERQLQGHWKLMLRFVGQSDGASLDELERFARDHGLDITRNTIRSQTSIYTNRGWLVRMGQGRFRLTDAGAEKCGYVEQAEGPTEVGPPQENGGGVVRAQVLRAERPGGPIPPTSTSHADDEELASIIGQPSGARPAQSEE